jgi:hypothetical protein
MTCNRGASERRRSKACGAPSRRRSGWHRGGPRLGRRSCGADIAPLVRRGFPFFGWVRDRGAALLLAKPSSGEGGDRIAQRQPLGELGRITLQLVERREAFDRYRRGNASGKLLLRKLRLRSHLNRILL